MTVSSTIALGTAAVGFRGRILALDMARAPTAGLPPSELERRLIELGFVEGASVELLHQGLFGGDPIAVRVAGRSRSSTSRAPIRCAHVRPTRRSRATPCWAGSRANARRT